MTVNYTDQSWVPKDWTDVQDYVATEFFRTVQKCQSPQAVFHVLAEAHYGMALFPVSFAVHCILLALKFRDDPDVSRFVYSNPAVSLVAFVLSLQFGCLSSSLLIGEIPLTCYLDYGDVPTIGLAAGVWFLVFFSPFDLFYKLCKISIFNFILYVMGSLRASRMVLSGVVLATQKYPNAPLAVVTTGVLKGTGAVFGLNLFKTLCVKESLEKERISDRVHVSQTTKMCFILSVMFTLTEFGVFKVPRDAVLFSGVLFVVSGRILGRLTASGDFLSVPATLLWKSVTALAPIAKSGDVKKLSSSSSPSKRKSKQEDREHAKKD